jgi:hypothetical protein
MVSPDLPDETVDAASARSTPHGASFVALPPAEPPVYRPRSRPVVWTFVGAFLVAAAASGLFAWLLLR